MIKYILRKIKKRKKLDEKGAVLIFSYLVLTVLFTLMASFAMSTVSELNNANRYRDEAIAFWIAEAGVNRFMQDTTILDGGDQTVYYGADSLFLSKDDSDSSLRIVTATGTVNGVSRAIQIEFPANPPGIFNNTMSSGGNINLIGVLAKMDVWGPTRITGSYTESGIGADGWFEDKQEGVPTNETTFAYPDTNTNGTPDEFADFVQFNQELLSTYDSSEYVYITSDATQLIYPNSSLLGKKVLFVEGSAPGTGDVNILFDTTWASDQNLTIITTGEVEYIQPLQFSTDSQLNIISWSGYDEASIFYSTHEGVTYTHDDANFYSIFALSETTGNLIANTEINANEALAYKKFYYDDPIEEGNIPPGFQGLINVAPAGYASTPNEWKEI